MDESCQQKAWNSDGQLGDSVKACFTAVTGHNGEDGMATSGTLRIRCPSWMVLLHLRLIKMYDEKILKSAQVKSFFGLKVWADSSKRWDFRNRPKKDTRQMAHNEAWRLELRFNRDRMPNRRSRLIGSRGLGGVPNTRLMPARTVDTTQMSERGFFCPNSLWSKPRSGTQWVNVENC